MEWAADTRTHARLIRRIPKTTAVWLIKLTLYLSYIGARLKFIVLIIDTIEMTDVILWFRGITCLPQPYKKKSASSLNNVLRSADSEPILLSFLQTSFNFWFLLTLILYSGANDLKSHWFRRNVNIVKLCWIISWHDFRTFEARVSRFAISRKYYSSARSNLIWMANF